MNKVIIAAAGSGKTEFIVNEALKKSSPVLITTFTDKNAEEIRNRFYKKNGVIPPNITILPWYTFLLTHFVKPYQDLLFTFDIKGVAYVGGSSGHYTKIGHEDHYFNADHNIYNDKIAELSTYLNKELSNHPLINLSKIFSHVFIDEVQDMSGYDLEMTRVLLKSELMNVICVGDPRQGVFVTSKGPKNKKYKRSEIIAYFEKNNIQIDSHSLNHNYRCIQDICTFADRLYPEYGSVASLNHEDTYHMGCYFVRPKDVEIYLAHCNPLQLKSNVNSKVNPNYPSMNFGLAKGITVDHVLIYPSQPMLKWILKGAEIESDEVKAKLYVAITRARFSVGIVCDLKKDINLKFINVFKGNY